MPLKPISNQKESISAIKREQVSMISYWSILNRQIALPLFHTIKKEIFQTTRTRSPLIHGNNLAHCILLSPASCSCLILAPVSLVHVSYLWYKGVIRIWVRQQRTYRQQYLNLTKKILTNIQLHNNSSTIIVVRHLRDINVYKFESILLLCINTEHFQHSNTENKTLGIIS